MAALNDRESGSNRGRLRGAPKCILSSDLWATLPDCLVVEEILAKLPLSSLVRSCRVCKRWRYLILHSRISPPAESPEHGYLSLFSNEKLTTFNPSTGTWETVPMRFLQMHFTLLGVVASAGGLLCFSTAVVGEYIVCNPLTKSFKRLQMPCSKEWSSFPGNNGESLRPFLVGMVLRSDTGHFKLIVAGLLPWSGGTTLAYDSHSNLWKKVANIPENSPKNTLPRNMHGIRMAIAIACGGNLYVHFRRCFLNSMPDRLLKYDVEQEEWNLISLPQVEGTLENITEFNGTILLVTSLTSDMQRSSQKKVTVFELQETGSKLWLPTDSLPFPRFCEALSNVRDSKCLGQGDVMYIVECTGINTGYRQFPRCEPNGSRASRRLMNVSVRELFPNVVTESYSEVNSKYWEEFEGDMNLNFPAFHIFRPSLMDVK